MPPLSIDKYTLTQEIFISTLIYIILVRSKLTKKLDDLSINLIGSEILFLIFFE